MTVAGKQAGLELTVPMQWLKIPGLRTRRIQGRTSTRKTGGTGVGRAGIADATEPRPDQYQENRRADGDSRTKTGLFLSRAHTLDGLELKVGFPWWQVLHCMDAPVWNPCCCARFADETVVDVDEHWVVVVLDALDKGGEEPCRLSDGATGHGTGRRTCLPMAGV